MVRQDSAFLKAQRLSKISKKIAAGLMAAETRRIPIERLLDWIELNTGLTRTRAQEYVDLIIRASDDWDRDGTTIFMAGAST